MGNERIAGSLSPLKKWARFAQAPRRVLGEAVITVVPVIEELVLIWTATDADEWEDRMLRIPRS